MRNIQIIDCKHSIQRNKMSKKIKLTAPLSESDLKVAEDYLRDLIAGREMSDYMAGRVSSIAESISLLHQTMYDIEG